MEALADSLIIPLKGLPRGASTFDFAIGAEFFQKFGNTRIKDADCSVRAQVVRGSTLASIRCIVGGFVVVDCDRCLDDLTLKVDVERELTVGFGAIDIDDAADEEDEDTSGLIALDEGLRLLLGGSGSDDDDEAGDVAGDEGYA